MKLRDRATKMLATLLVLVMLCGSMANPFALEFTGDSQDGEDPAVAYATVYPAGIFLRVISAQLIMILLG